MNTEETLAEMRRLHEETMQARSDVIRIARRLNRRALAGVADIPPDPDDERQRIRECIEQHEPISVREIAQRTHITTTRVKAAIDVLVNDGALTRHEIGRKIVYKLA